MRSQLLGLLRDARDRGVKLDPQASQDPIGARLARTGRDRDPGARRLADGRCGSGPLARQISQSPGSGGAVAGAAQRADRRPCCGARVALLLPLSGPAAAQALTVRDGFLSAYYQLPAANRPELRLYDTGSAAGP